MIDISLGRNHLGFSSKLAGNYFIMDYCVVISTCVAVLLYVNTFQAGFAYDDSRAIQKNPDLLPTTPISNIFQNDFWGTPLTHSGSHKSYRPICVLTFRLNYFLGDLDPFGYHVVNVLCHAVTTGVFTYLARVLVRSQMATLCSGLLFASHPIHTEAVAGVVGRADVMACLTFLLALLGYMNYVTKRDHADWSCARQTRWLPACLVMVVSAVGMLTKEHAVTVLGVCAICDVFVWSRAKIKDVLTLKILTQKRFRPLLEGLILLTIYTTSLIAFRLYYMGNKPPEFAPSDNPAADAESLQTRWLTFLYLPAANFWMLLCPRTLSFDWSMEAIPLFEGLSDPRNIFTVIFYALLCLLCYKVYNVLENDSDIDYSKQHKSLNGHSIKSSPSHNNHTNNNNNNNHHQISSTSSSSSSSSPSYKDSKRHNNNLLMNGNAHDVIKSGHTSSSSSSSITPPHHYRTVDIVIISTAITILPFLPATNLLFYVGFVIAERILYIPSMGVCLLVGVGVDYIYRHVTTDGGKKAVMATVCVLLVSFSGRTLTRNQDWETEERLYSSGVAVNPAKAWGNLANIYNDQNRTMDAEESYRNALSYRPNMADVHYNLGILLQNQRRFQESAESYSNAIKFRPKLSVAYLNLGILAAQMGDTEKAKDMYSRCASLDTSGLKDPRLHDATKISCLFNHGRLMMDENDNQRALELFETAMSRRPDHYSPHSLYNMIGEVYFKEQDFAQAEKWYSEALKAKPDHIPAHLTMAKMYQAKNNYDEASRWFAKAKEISPNDVTIDFHKAQFYANTKREKEAIAIFQEILPKVGDDFDVIYNAAHTYREYGDNERAEQLYVKAVQMKPKDPIVHMNMGAMYHMNNKLKEAEQSYLTALRLQPDSQVTQQNLVKLRNLMASRAAHSKG